MKPTAFSWLTFAMPRADKSPAAVGGVVEFFTAGGSLNTGDIVYISAADTVNKSATQANYVGFAGVVVGGQLTNDNVATSVGVAAATTGQRVMVQVSGVATVVAGGTVTVGTNFSVIPDTGTAGRVVAGTTAGQVVGKTLTTGAAAGTMKILISHR
jgi:hypothetical protein